MNQGQISPKTVVDVLDCEVEDFELDERYVYLNTEKGVSLNEAPRTQQILKCAACETEDENKEDMPSRRKNVKFDCLVSVVAIPSHRHYSSETKELLYTGYPTQPQEPDLAQVQRAFDALSQRQLKQDPFGLLDLSVTPNTSVFGQKAQNNLSKKTLEVLLLMSYELKNRKLQQEQKMKQKRKMAEARKRKGCRPTRPTVINQDDAWNICF